jgi:hypothetical protein
MAKRERYMLKVRDDGAFVPADVHTCARLREKRYKTGAYVAAELYRARNPGFHRLAHAFGDLVRNHIDGFEHLDAHKTLKRLQLEAGAGCDELMLQVPGVGPVPYKIPKSLSFESLDEAEFRQVFTAMCEHVSNTYWPSLSADDIEEMAEAMPQEVA